jgi:ABC-type polar amino acid transport system ATPase subunit
VIDISSLNKSYGGTRVLHDVNLQVEPGEVVVIIGPSGAGRAPSCDASTCSRCPIQAE